VPYIFICPQNANQSLLCEQQDETRADFIVKELRFRLHFFYTCGIIYKKEKIHAGAGKMEETVKKQDRRVQRTRKAIRSAFLRLLTDKDLEKISIKEIADLADVDRKTVYNYYNGVYDILDELETELAQDFERAIDNFDFATRDVQDIFIELARLLNQRLDIYSLLMKIDGNSRLVSKCVVYLKEKIEQVLGRVSVYSGEKIDVAAEFITAGMYMAYRHWFNSDRKKPLEEFTLDVSRLIMGGLPSYFFSL
jgi:AcrR family transcriptional regulator